MGVTTATRARVRDDLVRIASRAEGLPDLVHGITRCLQRAVPFEGSCLLTVDPATLLPTGEVVENGLPPAARVRLTEIELGEPDFNKFAALAHDPMPAASLSAATGGDLDRSVRQREVRRPSGFEDELRAVLTGPTGSWGTLTLLREARRTHFTPADVRFVASVGPTLAEGVRRTSLIAESSNADDRSETGFLVLAGDDTVEMANPAAQAWIDELSSADRAGPALPVAVRTVATQARRAAAGGGGVLARARVHTRRGRWVVVRGSDVGDDHVAVLIEAARPAELASAIVEVYGFTERERLITQLVAQGLSTRAIADRLHLSSYTVQDHLKAIFDKSGTGSRGELVARLFFDHHVPRLHDDPSTAP
jgi:DNA-binding NarL/FixJ family response regulator